ncbi:hypothetical protein STCU_12225 [Strigomonas culicis]|uniref:Uncharacterized protein n=1 Tax=Strigomonas culicis TaxID=28005 RepID=S9TFW4_9TRYP|nr:hypothetical protein STCU_12225 [Strigomonas culicis]|eukprot:EPY15228.1 hypothetical protein STCU_12225 [Strigomonas culicis]
MIRLLTVELFAITGLQNSHESTSPSLVDLVIRVVHRVRIHVLEEKSSAVGTPPPSRRLACGAPCGFVLAGALQLSVAAALLLRLPHGGLAALPLRLNCHHIACRGIRPLSWLQYHLRGIGGSHVAVRLDGRGHKGIPVTALVGA